MHNFQNHIENYAIALEQLGQKCGSTEGVAVDAVNYLYNRLNNGDNNPCALIRFFRTVAFEDLTPNLKGMARQSLADLREQTVNCLTLLAACFQNGMIDSNRVTTK